MCVIIIKQDDRVIDPDILENSSFINPHGLGVVWLDNYKIEYFNSKDWSVLSTERPFIAHFRYATVGKVNKANMHPFKCGAVKDEYLMQNGTVHGLGSEKMTDTEHLANILGTMPRKEWKKELSEYDCRFVTINTKTKSFQMYNRSEWVKHDGVWYSKGNVLARHYIAVYGTLKYNHSNYYHYLYDSKFVGSGETKDKYPLVIDGLPYVVEKKGLGHNVKVDVFKVTDEVLEEVDALEGHPNWYYRKQIDIEVGFQKKRTIKCWLYFNPIEITKDTVFHKSYFQSYSHYGTQLDYGRGYDWGDSWALDTWPSSKSEPVDEHEKDTNLCPFCGDYLESDGYDNHYCHMCEDWFTSNEIDSIKI